MYSLRRTGSMVALATLAAALALVPTAPTASARAATIVGGKTHLTFNLKMVERFAAFGVEAKGTTHRAVGGRYSFRPLSKGGGGRIRHTGGLTFSGGGRRVTLKRLVVTVPTGSNRHRSVRRRTGVLRAKLTGRRFAFARLGTERYKANRAKHRFTGLGVRLTETGANVLNASLGIRGFVPGLKLGRLTNRSRVGGSGRVRTPLAQAAARSIHAADLG